MWTSGSRKWWVSHECEDGPKGLDTDRELPQCFASIRKEMEDAQRAEDGGDAEVVGFKHDETYELVVAGNFSVLSGGKSEKGFISRLFGR